MTVPQNPTWVEQVNREGEYFDLPNVVPLHYDALINAAVRRAALDDFGEDGWQEPLKILCDDLDDSAELTLMGRLLARNDILQWLDNRLQITALIKQHPEIALQPIISPTFIVGLPRSGTSILFEVLSQDGGFGVAKTWEAMIPCPPPEAATYLSDARIDQAQKLATQWNRLVPEFSAVHEMGGNVPAECGLLMAGSFISDHIASLQMGENYSAWYATADMAPAYRFHKQVLQVLQWKNSRRRWLLKAPAHQNHLPLLLSIYPDARIIQTHRDPIKCMGSASHLMSCLYKMRSDKAFDSAAFDDFLMGEATAQRLELVIQQCQQGLISTDSIYNSRYCDLMDDPMHCVEGIYAHFGFELSPQTRQKMQDYLAAKPQGKFGVHQYRSDTSERHWFQSYQAHYDVPSEV